MLEDFRVREFTKEEAKRLNPALIKDSLTTLSLRLIWYMKKLKNKAIIYVIKRYLEKAE